MLDDDTLVAVLAVCLKEIERKKRKKRLWMKDRNKKRNEFTYHNLLEELRMTPKKDFRQFLVSDAAIYEELLSMIGPLIKKKDTNMRDAVPVGLRLSTTLRFLATGCHFGSMQAASTMSISTISKTVLETCEAIISRLREFMKLPETQEEWKSISNDFYKKWNIPNCLGVVDGKHIAIIKPTGTQDFYLNYKKFYSVVLTAVVNSNYEFIAVDVDNSSKITGQEDFRHTSLGGKIFGNGSNIPNSENFGTEECLPFVFVGRNTFQLTDKFLKPIHQKHLTREQKVFNYSLRRVHQVVENTFGILSSQFGVFQIPICLAPEKVKTIVLTCCYLHNFLRRRTQKHLWDGILDKEDLRNGVLKKGSWRDVAKLTPLQSPLTECFSSNTEDVKDKFIKFLTKK